MNYTEDYYAILGISYPSSSDEIKKAYHNLAKQTHPDIGGETEAMKRINHAYNVLADAKLKAAYDQWYSKKNADTIPDIDIVIHIITLEGGYTSRTIKASSLKFPYDKYLDENGELYFYETRQGSKINTVVTYKTQWLEMRYKFHPELNPRQPFYKNIKAIYFMIGIALILIVIFLFNDTKNTVENSDKNDVTYQNQSIPTPTPRPTLPPQEPTPETGQVLKWPVAECVAPLTIETDTELTNYYIYLQEANGNTNNDMSFFIRGGDTYEFTIPIGTYKIYYCSGDIWYGVKYRFGYHTSYATSDELLEFTYDNEYVYGHTITLYPVAYGNFQTEEIDETEFPE